METKKQNIIEKYLDTKHKKIVAGRFGSYGRHHIDWQPSGNWSGIND